MTNFLNKYFRVIYSLYNEAYNEPSWFDQPTDGHGQVRPCHFQFKMVELRPHYQTQMKEQLMKHVHWIELINLIKRFGILIFVHFQQNMAVILVFFWGKRT